ncbi:hypothetical protein [Antarcticimicrobium sediminis]|uniref:Uncharacterized protein n=1 Tax=Antarcticimicrobium sediminis TaxID=2546227 RepID=A0A4R5EYN0_9RHOB|nr:hypothetical protein [Antarcticimicrobium sediminis]TDE40141.1 hypothetical protein E1B25_04090 [Antarcticimicrobium sediminis]
MRLIALLLALSTSAATAQEVVPVPYGDLETLAPHLVNFDRLPAKRYPGYNFDHGVAFPGGYLGEAFRGQSVEAERIDDGGPHDVLHGAPAAPLAIRPGSPGQVVSLSQHEGFGSMALYPLGALGQPDPLARGEGAMAVLLHQDACAVGLRIHTEFTNALGLKTRHRGLVTLTLYARDGTLLARVPQVLPDGITEHALFDPAARIAGMTVENRDPGGIALDDLRFGCPALTG